MIKNRIVNLNLCASFSVQLSMIIKEYRKSNVTVGW